MPYHDDVFGDAMEDLIMAPFDVLLGRKTYEIVAGYWPYQSADNPLAQRFNGDMKWIATLSNTRLTWNAAVALNCSGNLGVCRVLSAPPAW